MISLTDPTGNKIILKEYPKKIISLVPSQTELLHYLNLENEVVGITKFCIHPNEWFKNKQRVGGTKNIKFDVIKKINPDLVSCAMASIFLPSLLIVTITGAVGRSLSHTS